MATLHDAALRIIGLIEQNAYDVGVMDERQRQSQAAATAPLPQLPAADAQENRVLLAVIYALLKNSKEVKGGVDFTRAIPLDLMMGGWTIAVDSPVGESPSTARIHFMRTQG